MKYKFKPVYVLLLLTLITRYLGIIDVSKASINKEENDEIRLLGIEDKSLVNINTNILEKNFYILGPGDRIQIKFVGVDELSGIFFIMRDGNIQLPLLGTQNIEGLTLDEAKNKLIELYGDELISPEIDLTLISARPVRVSLIGEVERPGSYTFSGSEGSEGSNVLNSGSAGTTITGFKTVVDAIQKAGGLTFDADITKVKLFRKLPGNKEEFKKAELDLLNMIKTGNQINNPIIFDGDRILIEKITSQANPLEGTPNNLTPETIKLHVIGEVSSPGVYQVDSKTRISQAVLIAGGPISWRYKDKIELLRVNRNGSVDVKKISFNKKGLSKKVDKISLRNGDIIRVHKNLFGKSSDALGTILPPIRDMYSLYGVYKLIND
ncbi:MAG: SLBB domain-containing protein [Prochlorococcus marinus CUG1436]|nr:SLBB domain-containing protein [Prochlorococcus marinus CUG1436]